jgi:hypothetical protein
MTKAVTYKQGNAAAYHAWLEQQSPKVAKTASRFRPWEVYKWQGREIYGHVIDYDTSGALVVFQREDGASFVVTPTQIDLFSATGEELPPDRLYQA